MDETSHLVRERIALVATNRMRIAGFQAIFGDPCGVELVPVDVGGALRSRSTGIVLVDAGSTGSLFHVLAMFRQTSPLTRLVVIDQEMSAATGRESGHEADYSYIERVIRSGAKGFLGAAATVEEFRVALENVRDGSIWAPRKVLSRLIETQFDEQGAAERFSEVRFTPRESQVLGLLLGGKSNRDIGAHLGIDAVTVKAHLGRIMRKAGVGNRIELTMYALSRRSGGTSSPNR